MKPLIALATLVGMVELTSMAAGPPRKEDIPKFITALKSSANPKERIQAADDIAYRGAIRASDVDIAIDPLVSSLKKDKDPEVRAHAPRPWATSARTPTSAFPR